MLLPLTLVRNRVGGFRVMGHTASEPGWTTPASAMFFLAGLQLFILGVMGEYIGRIYTKIKQRPRWVIRAKLGFDEHCEDPLCWPP